MDEQRFSTCDGVESDESSVSTMSEDSCEYYHTEIYDQLPSVQAVRAKRDTKGERAPTTADAGRQQYGQQYKSKKASATPIRNYAVSMQEKREIRRRRKLGEIPTVGHWDNWKQTGRTQKKLWGKVLRLIIRLIPLRGTLRRIEARFGFGVKSYFILLRYLIYLNILHSVVVGCFILLPTILKGRIDHDELFDFHESDSVLDFIMGTGYMQRSPMFYGFYMRSPRGLSCFNTPLLYLTGVLVVLILSFIMVVRRMTVGYKYTLMLGKRYKMNSSFKIFTGWDFTIQDPQTAVLKQSFIKNDLRLFLQEQQFALRQSQRTFGQWMRLYLLRLALNLVVGILLAGACCLIYFATNASHSWGNKGGNNMFFSLVREYLNPFTITMVNLLLPHLFSRISAFEDYSITNQINATLVRSCFLKLFSLGIYLLFLFNTGHPRCWENQFGKELYKLCVFNFLAAFSVTMLLDYPVKVFQETYPTWYITKLLGKRFFLIPFNVLDLVYTQTVLWVGVYYCPLLPIMGAITLMATFFVKKFSVLRCCEAEPRMFRGSNCSVMFHLMLLFGLLMALVFLGCNIYSLPKPAQKTLRYLASEAFAVAVIFAQIIILTSYVSRARANQRAIERLKGMLIVTSSDKRFLVKKHTTVLRQQRLGENGLNNAKRD